MSVNDQRFPAHAETPPAALASAIHPSDPMDRAVRSLCPAVEGQATLSRNWPLQTDRMAVVQQWTLADGTSVAAAKGAPEAVFSLCRLSPSDVSAAREDLDRMAAEGLRVLAVASIRGLRFGPMCPRPCARPGRPASPWR